MPQENQQPSRPSAASGTVPRTRLFAPLFLKVFIVLLVALTPPALVTAAYLGFFSSISGIDATRWLPTGTINVLGYIVSAMLATVSAAFLAGLLLGLIVADTLFIHRARRVLSFVLQIRSASFASVPVMPHLGHDEIGEIGRQVAYSSVHFSQVGEAAKGATEQRSLFIMTAAHQLRTPLTGLIWTIEQLQKNEMPPEERAQLLSAVDSSIRRMRLVIEHILASANVEEGRFGYVFEQTDLVPVVEKLIQEFKPLSEKRRVTVSFTHEGAFPVYADAERISLVLFDLVSNAIDYTPEEGSVAVSFAPRGDDLEIAVADTGIGIAASELPLLFNKFYRSERARHMRPDGSGLGLYLARIIVERHGAELKINSVEGKGTRISFALHSDKAKIPH